MHQMTTLTVNIMLDILLDEVVLGELSGNTRQERGAMLSLRVGGRPWSQRTNCRLLASLLLITNGWMCLVVKDSCLLGWNGTHYSRCVVQSHGNKTENMERALQSIYRHSLTCCFSCSSFLFTAHLSMRIIRLQDFFYGSYSLCLTLFENLSLGFKVVSLGNKTPIPVSFGAHCTTECAALCSFVQCVACKMTSVLHFNIKVFGRSL